MRDLLSGSRLQLLATARLLGSSAVGIVAQVAVDMPAGYFGATDRITRAGMAYSILLALMVVLMVVGLYRRWEIIGWLPPTVHALNVGIFVPAAVSDLVVAGGVVAWNLVLLAQDFFPPLSSHRARSVADREEQEISRQAPAVRHLAMVSLVLTIAVVGYRLSESSLAQILCMVFGFGTLLVAVPLLLLLRQQGSRLILLIPVPAVAAMVAIGSPTTMLGLLALTQALLLSILLARQQSTVEIVHSFYDNPSRLIVVTFAAVIITGTMLLTFPAAAGAAPVHPIDALFTATSATCVTGLIVLDTPGDFSFFGQLVILALIQVGGLGFMVVSTFAMLLLGGRLGLKGEQALSEVLNLEAGAAAYRVTRFVVLATLGIEALGAVGMAVFYHRTGLGTGEAIWRGIFHSISAFCNAGFALQSDSIVMFHDSPLALLLLAALIIAGGLGFVVLAGLARRLLVRGPRPRLTVQARVVLVTSAVLLVSGMALYAAGEWERSLGGLKLGDKLLNAFFQSVTLRTAGFNTVDLGVAAPTTVFFMILFMFIGASPGSTGGGIKTTTVAVLFAAMRSTLKGHEPVTLCGREVPRDLVMRSLAIVVISAAVVTLGLFLLLLFEPLPFEKLLFETVSAFGTVGLSLGTTPMLGPAGKLVIIVMIFIGRIGPLTLALLLGAAHRKAPVSHFPQARFMVG